MLNNLLCRVLMLTIWSLGFCSVECASPFSRGQSLLQEDVPSCPPNIVKAIINETRLNVDLLRCAVADVDKLGAQSISAGVTGQNGKLVVNVYNEDDPRSNSPLYEYLILKKYAELFGLAKQFEYEITSMPHWFYDAGVLRLVQAKIFRMSIAKENQVVCASTARDKQFLAQFMQSTILYTAGIRTEALDAVGVPTDADTTGIPTDALEADVPTDALGGGVPTDADIAGGPTDADIAGVPTETVRSVFCSEDTYAKAFLLTRHILLSMKSMRIPPESMGATDAASIYSTVYRELLKGRTAIDILNNTFAPVNAEQVVSLSNNILRITELRSFSEASVLSLPPETLEKLDKKVVALNAFWKARNSIWASKPGIWRGLFVDGFPQKQIASVLECAKAIEPLDRNDAHIFLLYVIANEFDSLLIRAVNLERGRSNDRTLSSDVNSFWISFWRSVPHHIEKALPCKERTDYTHMPNNLLCSIMTRKYMPVYDYLGYDLYVDEQNDKDLVWKIEKIGQSMSLQSMVSGLRGILSDIVPIIREKDAQTYNKKFECFDELKAMLRRFIELGGYHPEVSPMPWLIRHSFPRDFISEIDEQVLDTMQDVDHQLYKDYILPCCCSSCSSNPGLGS
ncbi:MAG: hypothetical protein LBR89_02070 [Holosporales bacterium]|jgi:hypothetical protein|nr:hypothetical protein [Holosporales bacterium]